MDIRIISGRVGKDAQIKKRKSGTSYISYSVCVDLRNAENKEVRWFNCIQNVYGEGAARLAEYIKKGNMVILVGRSDEIIGDDGGIVRYFSVNEIEFVHGNNGNNGNYESEEMTRARNRMKKAGFDKEEEEPF